MSRKKATSGKCTPSVKVNQAATNRQRRRLFKRIRRIAIAAALFSIAATGLAMYKQQYEMSHDLSVIGNGTPTVVQVHDPNCSLCRKLRDNVDAVKGEFGDRVQFRIADISTSQGRSLANRYNVPHVTLLLFDANGKMVATMTGVREPNELRSGFKTLL